MKAPLLRSIVLGFFLICLDINKHVQSNSIRKVPPFLPMILIFFNQIESKLFVKLTYKLFDVHKQYVWINIKVIWFS